MFCLQAEVFDLLIYNLFGRLRIELLVLIDRRFSRNLQYNLIRGRRVDAINNEK
jgi:hypothetical protein